MSTPIICPSCNRKFNAPNVAQPMCPNCGTFIAVPTSAGAGLAVSQAFRAGVKPGMLFLAFAVGIALGCIIGFAGGFLLGRSNTGEPVRIVGAGVKPGPKTIKKSSVLTRDEFRNIVIGMKSSEVLKRFGKPYSTSEYGSGRKIWRYRYLTWDGVVEEADNAATITFEDDVATKVSFS
jgi:hypothetical protein